MKKTIIFFLLLVIFGCKKDPYVDITFEAPVFKDSMIVNPVVLNDTIFTKFVAGINSYKDYIVLYANIVDYQLHLFDKKDGRLVKSFAALGRGPQEVLLFDNYSFNEEMGIASSIYTMQKKVVTFYIDSILENKSHFMDKMEYDGYDKIAWTNIYKCRQGYLMGGRKYETHPDGYRLTRLSDDFKIIGSYNDYPLLVNAEDSVNLALDWDQLRISSTLSPDGSKYAEATQIGGIIETFSIGNQIERTALKGFYKPHFYKDKNNVVFTEKTALGFYYLKATNSYLYALSYNGRNLEVPSCEVLVFDWQGNPVKKYINGKYRFMSICPDEKDGKMYAIAITGAREFILVAFDI